jgi:lactate dehydrogenase-like 2-hydroxyacid dehydrogenase
MTQRVLVTRSDFPGNGLDRLAARSELVLWTRAGVPSADDLRALVPGASGVLAVSGDLIDETLLQVAGPSLKVVALASMGYDRVDQQAAAAHGVVVTNTPGVLAETTADLAFALILMARRRLGEASRELLEGRWEGFSMSGFLGLDVHGATLGILGYGEIGRAVARRGRGFGMHVQHHSRSARSDDLSQAVDLPTLLAGSDVVSIHVPLTPDTRHLIGAPELAAMKPTATLVNTARGPVVDEQALIAALREGRLHSAGLDVFEREPLGDALAGLTDVPGLVMLPHIGSATLATRSAMVDLAVDNLLAVLGGGAALTPLPAPGS